MFNMQQISTSLCYLSWGNFEKLFFICQYNPKQDRFRRKELNVRPLQNTRSRRSFIVHILSSPFIEHSNIDLDRCQVKYNCPKISYLQEVVGKLFQEHNYQHNYQLWRGFCVFLFPNCINNVYEIHACNWVQAISKYVD